MNLSCRLREERTKNNWTQKQAAKNIGISRSFYSDLENGKSLPSYQTLQKINNVFPFFLPSDDAYREFKGVRKNVQ